MKRLYSIGHSTRTFEAFLSLLRAHSIVQLADVRSYPASRRHPDFGRSQLEPALLQHGIAYEWMPGLGGRRKVAPGSQNTGWRVDGFRAYADHMQTPEFAAAVAELESWAEKAPTAFMCAEAYFRKCHRQLLSDALVAKGWEVLHIASERAAEPHRMTGFACLQPDGTLLYPGEAELDL